jgi:hypothetical protein
MKNKLSILISIVITIILISPILVKEIKAETQFSASIIDSLIGTTNQNNGGLLDFLKAESEINLDYDKSSVEDPLIPNKDFIVPVNVSYSISGLFAGLYSKILSNSEVTIDLSVETNKYVTASISPKSINANITSEETTLNVEPKITVNINSEAVARQELKITLIAKTGEVRGILGLFPFIKESDNITKEIKIIPEYLPLIEVESNIDFKEIPPFNVTELNVNITNNGNGKTKVLMEAINVTEHFNVSLQDSIIIGINETKQVTIELIPDNDFDEESLKISFTPSYFEDLTLTGSATIYEFTLENDGSYKEEDDGLGIDISIIIILGFAVLLLLIFIFIIRKRL